MATTRFSDEIDWNTPTPMSALPPPDDFANDEPTIETAPIVIDTPPELGQVVISTQARDLANQESAVLKEHGIGASEQLYQTGTKLAQIGLDNLKRYKSEYDALPTTGDALAAFSAQIRAEDRKDTTIEVTDYRLDVDGKLAHKSHALGGKGVALEATPYKALGAIAGSLNINAGLSKVKTPVERVVRARTLPGASRSAFALVSRGSKGYTVCDGDKVADLMAQGLREAGMLNGSKTDLRYTPHDTRYKIRTILQAPIDIPAFTGVGRVHQVFLDISGADDGEASITGESGAIRVRCMNASLSKATGTSFRRVHRGDLTQIRQLVADLTRSFGTVAKSMRDVWMQASANYYLDSEGGKLSPSEAIERLVRNGLLPTGERTEEQAIDRYTAAWRAEEGVHSAAGVIMAIQRAAHEADWGSDWATSEIEECASKMLYQPVYTLKQPTA